jgi:hypothetical protein
MSTFTIFATHLPAMQFDAAGTIGAAIERATLTGCP